MERINALVATILAERREYLEYLKSGNVEYIDKDGNDVTDTVIASTQKTIDLMEEWPRVRDACS